MDSDSMAPEANQLERYLDGLMAEREAKQFLRTSDSELVERSLAMQFKIDNSLRRLYHFDPISVGAALKAGLKPADVSPQIELASAQHRPVNPPHGEFANSTTRRNWLQLAIPALVAGIAGLVIWSWPREKESEVMFLPTSLAVIFADTVERGFRPYYNCEDEQRFADTFEFRLGTPLALSPLPNGSKMLGLSYSGGISRKTTAMLCEVDNQEVMVFVDVDRGGNLGPVLDNDSAVNIFVEKKNGLVFCEVTPLQEPRIIPYFEFVE